MQVVTKPDRKLATFQYPLQRFQLSFRARMNELVFTLEARRLGAPDGVIWLNGILVRELSQ